MLCPRHPCCVGVRPPAASGRLDRALRRELAERRTVRPSRFAQQAGHVLLHRARARWRAAGRSAGCPAAPGAARTPRYSRGVTPLVRSDTGMRSQPPRCLGDARPPPAAGPPGTRRRPAAPRPRKKNSSARRSQATGSPQPSARAASATSRRPRWRATGKAVDRAVEEATRRRPRPGRRPGPAAPRPPAPGTARSRRVGLRARHVRPRTRPGPPHPPAPAGRGAARNSRSDRSSWGGPAPRPAPRPAPPGPAPGPPPAAPRSPCTAPTGGARERYCSPPARRNVASELSMSRRRPRCAAIVAAESSR
ncbi:hypothetical protein SMICM304S_01263 [Streptomyces microflavus]